METEKQTVLVSLHIKVLCYREHRNGIRNHIISGKKKKGERCWISHQSPKPFFLPSHRITNSMTIAI